MHNVPMRHFSFPCFLLVILVIGVLQTELLKYQPDNRITYSSETSDQEGKSGKTHGLHLQNRPIENIFR